MQKGLVAVWLRFKPHLIPRVCSEEYLFMWDEIILAGELVQVNLKYVLLPARCLPIAQETALAAATLWTEYGPDGCVCVCVCVSPSHRLTR